MPTRSWPPPGIDPPPGALAAPLLLESRARLRLARHRHADAHADLLAAAKRWNELGIRHPGLAAWRVHACETFLARGELHAARELVKEHLALAERVELPGPRGAGLRALAATTDRKQAVVLLEQAVDVLAGSAYQLEHVRALVELGTALRRADRRAAARTPFGARSTWPTGAECANWRAAPDTNSKLSAPDPVAAQSPASTHSLPPNIELRRSPRRGTATPRSPSSSSSPGGQSRHTSRTSSRSWTSPRALTSGHASPRASRQHAADPPKRKAHSSVHGTQRLTRCILDQSGVRHRDLARHGAAQEAISHNDVPLLNRSKPQRARQRKNLRNVSPSHHSGVSVLLLRTSPLDFRPAGAALRGWVLRRRRCRSRRTLARP